jgi:antirestriction protein
MINSNIQIYVACLSAYNHGTLHGEWIDATQDADSIMSDIQDMLATSPAKKYGECEEWAIHESVGFGEASISESEDIETVSALAQFIEKNGEAGLAFIENCDYDAGSIEEQFSDLYMGDYASLADYAEEMYEGEEIPEVLQRYIDWAAMGRDMELSGYISVVEHPFDRVFIFQNS